MQGARPGVGSTANEGDASSIPIDAIVKRAKCNTFLCLQAECAPEEGASLIDDGGCQRWKSDPKRLPAYSRQARSVAREAGVPPPTFLHYGIGDDGTFPSMDRLNDVVLRLAERIRSGDTVYVHCWGGKGRSGLVAACLLGELYPELDADAALEYVDQFCRLRHSDGREDVRCSSPEHEAQKRQVRDFYARIRA